MDPLLLLVAIAFAALAVVLVRRAAGASQPQTSRGMAHVATYQQLGRIAPTPAATESVAEAPDVRAAALLEAVGRHLVRRIDPVRLEALRARLRSAGFYSVTPELFLGAQALLTGGGVLLSVLLAAQGLGVAGGILFAIFTGCIGFAVPLTIVSRRARLRTESIDRQMPELVDLLVVAIEAGLGLGAALDRAASHMSGALAGELRLVLQEQGLGATSAEALEHLVLRSDTPTVRTFVRTLVQGERLGVPIGQTMRAIALDMRKRRRAAAETMAQKAPIKILFPLVFCIFPSLLAVVLAPAAISILQGGLG